MNTLLLLHQKQQKKNLLFLNKNLPSIHRFIGLDNKLIVDGISTKEDINEIKKVIQDYISSLTKLPHRIIWNLYEVSNNTFLLNVNFDPHYISELKNFGKIRINKDKFFRKGEFPINIKKNIIVTINLSERFKKLLFDINNKWNPENDFEKKRHIKFVIDRNNPYSLLVLNKFPYADELNPTYVGGFTTDYLNNMKILENKIMNYLKKFGINKQDFDFMYSDGYSESDNFMVNTI